VLGGLWAGWFSDLSLGLYPHIPSENANPFVIMFTFLIPSKCIYFEGRKRYWIKVSLLVFYSSVRCEVWICVGLYVLAALRLCQVQEYRICKSQGHFFVQWLHGWDKKFSLRCEVDSRTVANVSWKRHRVLFTNCSLSLKYSLL